MSAVKAQSESEEMSLVKVLSMGDNPKRIIKIKNADYKSKGYKKTFEICNLFLKSRDFFSKES
jgi:hypothetical protein